MSRIRVVLAGDREIVRSRCEVILADEHGIEVVGSASNGLDAIQKTKTLKPDVLLVELKMPGLNSFEVIRKVASLSPSTRIVAISDGNSRADIVRAIESGVHGYQSIGSDIADVVSAILRVHLGFFSVIPAYLNQRTCDSLGSPALSSMPCTAIC